MSILRIILLLFRALFRDRSQLALENLALRQQLAILHRKSPRSSLRRADRVFWVSLVRVWEQWCSALILVKPETVLRWHRLGFRYFWRWTREPTLERTPHWLGTLAPRLPLRVSDSSTCIALTMIDASVWWSRRLPVYPPANRTEFSVATPSCFEPAPSKHRVPWAAAQLPDCFHAPV